MSCGHHNLGGCRAAVASFLEDEATKRLLVYVDGKDLAAVRSGGVVVWCCLDLRRTP